MSFVASGFLLFFAGLWMLAAITSGTYRKWLLLAGSYYFYMTVDWRFGGLLLANTLIQYACAIQCGSRTGWQRRYWTALGIGSTLAILGYFKYAGFFLESLRPLLGMFGLDLHDSVANILLPVGISFFTFQGIGYLMDVYRGQTEPCRNLLSFSLFMAFFPQLMSGPIGRSRHLLPQFIADAPPIPHGGEQGIALMLRGYAKKLLLADPIATQLVDPAFASPESFHAVFLLLGLLAYTFYIYMDLSGYTDIARGVARCLGYDLAENFNRPYQATSVSAFWQRWHISMSSFFRDYLFFSLGGSRHGNVYFNLVITFVAIGMWHGAGYKFIVYGMLHGSVVAMERFHRLSRERRGLAPQDFSGWRLAVKVSQVMCFIILSRVLFRAADLESAIDYLRLAFSNGSGYMPYPLVGLCALIIAIALHYVPREWSSTMVAGYCKLPASLQAVGIALVACACIAVGSGGLGFVYFQF